MASLLAELACDIPLNAWMPVLTANKPRVRGSNIEAPAAAAPPPPPENKLPAASKVLGPEEKPPKSKVGKEPGVR